MSHKVDDSMRPSQLNISRKLLKQAESIIREHHAPAVTSDTLATQLGIDIFDRTDLHRFRRLEYILLQQDHVKFEPTQCGDIVWWIDD